MNEILRYKSYLSNVQYSADGKVFHGKVIGINDLVNFEGATVKELKKAFAETVDDYLRTCEVLEKEPDRTTS